MTQYKYRQVSNFDRPKQHIIELAEKLTGEYLGLLEKYKVIPSEDTVDDTISFWLGEYGNHVYFLEMWWGAVKPNSINPVKDAVPYMKITIVDYGDTETEITCGILEAHKDDTNSI